jgi:hypothetical protein
MRHGNTSTSPFQSQPAVRPGPDRVQRIIMRPARPPTLPSQLAPSVPAAPIRQHRPRGLLRVPSLLVCRAPARPPPLRVPAASPRQLCNELAEPGNTALARCTCARFMRMRTQTHARSHARTLTGARARVRTWLQLSVRQTEALLFIAFLRVGTPVPCRSARITAPRGSRRRLTHTHCLCRVGPPAQPTRTSTPEPGLGRLPFGMRVPSGTISAGYDRRPARLRGGGQPQRECFVSSDFFRALLSIDAGMALSTTTPWFRAALAGTPPPRCPPIQRPAPPLNGRTPAPHRPRLLPRGHTAHSDSLMAAP